MSDIREKLAEFHYEASRRRVSGRPAWAKLKQDSYDQGMRARAFEEADAMIAAIIAQQGGLHEQKSLGPK